MAQLDDIQLDGQYNTWRTKSFGDLAPVAGGPEKGGTYALVTVVKKMAAQIDALSTGGVDLDALAAKVAALVPKPPTAAEIAAEIATRLGNG